MFKRITDFSPLYDSRLFDFLSDRHTYRVYIFITLKMFSQQKKFVVITN